MKAYLKYELLTSFGLIASNANVLLVEGGRLAVTAALECVAVWNLRQGTLVKKLVPGPSASGRPAAEILCLAVAPDGDTVAAGHADGSIRLWSLASGECRVTLAGHRSGVTALRFGREGSVLASGGQDTEVVLWDTVAEAGLVRLRGHTGPVTDLAFVDSQNILLTGSKDSHVRVWDLEAQYCFQTLVLPDEVRSLDTDPGETRLAVGGQAASLSFFRILPLDQQSPAPSRILLQDFGTVKRATASAEVGLLRYEPSGQLLVCQSAGKGLEVFRVRSAAEARKHISRRRKRKRDKLAKASAAAEDAVPAGAEPDVDNEGLTVADELVPFQVVHAKHKLRGFAFGPEPYRPGRPLQITWALANNCIEVWNLPEARGSAAEGPAKPASKDAVPGGAVPGEGAPAEPDRASVIELPGHRAAVRGAVFALDDSVVATVGGNTLKVWNPRTGAVIRTLPTGKALCLIFAPGDRHVVVGCEEGRLQLLDLSSSSVIADIAAHDEKKRVLALAALPDKTGFISGSDDGTVKIWEWEVVTPPEGPRLLSARLARTLRIGQEVLTLRASPDGRLLAVALLDCTIQVFFLDSLKLFLPLYGHKLPVLAMDITSDSTLLVSGGADKNIRVWGLDFGDCHCSIFAHDSNITQVACVPDTHYCFTAGKDKTVKYWDLDRRGEVAALEGHAAEVWALGLSSDGSLLVSAGADRGLRVWERTEEPIFLEEERERRLESLFESQLEEAPRRQAGKEGEEVEATAGPAGRKTLQAVTAADNLVDALDLATHEERRRQEHEASGSKKALQANPMLMGLEPAALVLKTLAATPAADLEQTLLLLPFTDALCLLSYLCRWLQDGHQVELVTRVAALLVRINNSQLVATPAARQTLSDLATLLRKRTRELRDVIGFNLAALSHLSDSLKERQASFNFP